MWIFRKTGKVVSRQTVRVLTDNEVNSNVEQHKMKVFDYVIKEKLGVNLSVTVTDDFDTPDMIQ